MGYTTDFHGSITIDPPLNPAEIAYLTKFAETRRMRRTKGPYYIDGGGFAGQDHEPDIEDYNNPPEGQPGLWCKWIPTALGDAIEWDGKEKFYDPVEWMEYLVTHFLRPGAVALASLDPQFADFTFDHILNGHIDAQGEDPDDKWRLVVKNNAVRRVDAVITYPDETDPDTP